MSTVPQRHTGQADRQTDGRTDRQQMMALHAPLLLNGAGKNRTVSHLQIVQSLAMQAFHVKLVPSVICFHTQAVHFCL